jgi:hypothetical protein
MSASYADGNKMKGGDANAKRVSMCKREPSTAGQLGVSKNYSKTSIVPTKIHRRRITK